MKVANKPFMVVMAVFFLAVGGYLTFQTLDFLNGAEQVEAIITQMDINYGKGTSSATVAFEVAGQTKTAVVPMNHRLHCKGECIPVYYNPTKTPSVQLNQFTSIWLFPLSFIFLAGFIGLFLTFKK